MSTILNVQKETRPYSKKQNLSRLPKNGWGLTPPPFFLILTLFGSLSLLPEGGRYGEAEGRSVPPNPRLGQQVGWISHEHGFYIVKGDALTDEQSGKTL